MYSSIGHLVCSSAVVAVAAIAGAQIRDGGHGFSTLLGQYCGTEFPPVITSRERFLWLRFHSDENIEYQGFVIVYEFIPRPTSCTFVVYLDAFYAHFLPITITTQ